MARLSPAHRLSEEHLSGKWVLTVSVFLYRHILCRSECRLYAKDSRALRGDTEPPDTSAC